jgi:hypothetical protein
MKDFGDYVSKREEAVISPPPFTAETYLIYAATGLKAT